MVNTDTTNGAIIRKMIANQLGMTFFGILVSATFLGERLAGGQALTVIIALALILLGTIAVNTEEAV